MKLTKRAFTLVEMLIVVVIIGILIAALVPRLQWAQARARDTARKADLNQIWTALATYFNDEWKYVWSWCVSDIRDELIPTYISSIPNDPQASRNVAFAKDSSDDEVCTKDWSYWVLSIYNNWAEWWWVVLVANVEESKNANFVLAFSWNKSVLNNENSTAFVDSDCNWEVNLNCFHNKVELTTVTPAQCVKWVDVDASKSGGWCWWDDDKWTNKEEEWVAKTNQAAVYVTTRS